MLVVCKSRGTHSSSVGRVSVHGAVEDVILDDVTTDSV